MKNFFILPRFFCQMDDFSSLFPLRGSGYA